MVNNITFAEMRHMLMTLKDVIPENAPFISDGAVKAWLSALAKFSRGAVLKTFEMTSKRDVKFPALGSFVNYVALEEHQAVDRTMAAPSMCAVCHGSGQVSARRLLGPSYEAPYGFRCDKCDNAQAKNLSKLLPMWDDSRSSRFELLP